MARYARRQQPHSQRITLPPAIGPLTPGTPTLTVSAVTPTWVPGPVTYSPSTPVVSVVAVTPAWWDILPVGTPAVTLTPVQPTWVTVAVSPWRQRRRVPVIVT